MKTSRIAPFRTATREQWLADRQELLRQEKEFNRQRDLLSARRRELPWVKIAQGYTFDSPSGRVSLAGLFGDKSQLIVYHFMLGPGWEEGCKGCSFVSDHFDGALPHLSARDIAFTAVSGANTPHRDPLQLRRYNVEPYSFRTFELVLAGACDLIAIKDTVSGTHARRLFTAAFGTTSR